MALPRLSRPISLPVSPLCLPVSLPPPPRGTHRRRADVCVAGFNSTDEDITAQLGTEEFLQQHGGGITLGVVAYPWVGLLTAA